MNDEPANSSPGAPSRSARWLRVWASVRSAVPRWIWLGLLALALYWLYGFRPFLVHAELVVDDFLYVRHARGFLDWLQGRSSGWLGPYDCFLLSKAPLYGLWLALLNIFGIPLRIGEFLLVVAGPFLLARVDAGRAPKGLGARGARDDSVVDDNDWARVQE